MNDVKTVGVPGTLGGLAVGFAATHLLLASAHIPDTPPARRVAPYVDYTLSPSTHGELSGLFSGSGVAAIAAIASSIDLFYSDLLAKQERLGKELEWALFDNLWDLYAR